MRFPGQSPRLCIPVLNSCPSWKAAGCTPGKIKVLELSGTYRLMGRHYGALVKDDLTFVHRMINDVFITGRKMSPARVEWTEIPL
jgi:hypothetical protein